MKILKLKINDGDLDRLVNYLIEHLSFDYENAPSIQTFYIQEKLKKGYLLDMSIATSLAHSNEIVDKFLEATNVVFKDIIMHLENNSIEDHLIGEIRHSNFKRLTD